MTSKTHRTHVKSAADRNGRDIDMAEQNWSAGQTAPVNHVRSLGAMALTLAPLISVAWTARAWRGNLPDPLPTHWSALSTPVTYRSKARPF